MDKYDTRLIMVFVTLLESLAMAGCSILGTGTPVQPTETATSAATSIPTVVPTETPTPTEMPLSADNFKVENGQIEENVNGSWQVEQIPSDVGEIDSVELHEGQMYGIDTLGRAVIVQNGHGEWLDYERPVEICAASKEIGNIPANLLKDVNQEKVTRLNSDGSQLSWGIVQEEHDYPGRSSATVFVSGYSLGAFKQTINGITISSMVFEIPFRYQSQILIFVLPDQTDSFSVYSIPTSGDIKEIDERQVSYHDYLQMMSNPEIIGHQIVLAFNINSADTPNSVPGDGLNDAELNTLFSSLNAGEAVSAPLKGLLAAPTAWVGESFFKK